MYACFSISVLLTHFIKVTLCIYHSPTPMRIMYYVQRKAISSLASGSNGEVCKRPYFRKDFLPYLAFYHTSVARIEPVYRYCGGS